MGSKRTFLLIAAAAIAAPSIASAQDTGSRIIVIGAAQDREQRSTLVGAAQDTGSRIIVIGATRDRRTATAEAPADPSLRTLPVVYEDEPAPAPAPAPARTPAPAPAPTR